MKSVEVLEQIQDILPWVMVTKKTYILHFISQHTAVCLECKNLIMTNCLIWLKTTYAWDVPSSMTAICTKALFYAFFAFNAPCKFIPLINLYPLIFSLMLFGWFISISLSLFPHGHVIFYLCPLFQEHNLGAKQRLGVLHSFPSVINQCQC